MAKITVLNKEITFYSQKDADYICITDIARYKDEERSDYIIQNWLRNRNTIEFLGIWEHLNNPDFNSIEFDGIRKQAGLNSFSLTAKRWIEATNAIGLTSKTGRYGGTYAHKDIAFEFASWISVEFKRQYSRSREYVSARLPLESGKLECPIHPGKDATAGAAPQVEPDRHPPNETADRRRKNQAA